MTGWCGGETPILEYAPEGVLVGSYPAVHGNAFVARDAPGVAAIAESLRPLTPGPDVARNPAPAYEPDSQSRGT